MLLHQVINSCMPIIDPKIKMDLIDTTISRFKKEVLMKALKDQSNQKYYSDISLSMELLHKSYLIAAACILICPLIICWITFFLRANEGLFNSIFSAGFHFLDSGCVFMLVDLLSTYFSIRQLG